MGSNTNIKNILHSIPGASQHPPHQQAKNPSGGPKTAINGKAKNIKNFLQKDLHRVSSEN